MQQYLPFTVLKLCILYDASNGFTSLQQYLPFTVLKPCSAAFCFRKLLRVATVLTVYGIETPLIDKDLALLRSSVATVLTVYGIETPSKPRQIRFSLSCCNSTYRLRY